MVNASGRLPLKNLFLSSVFIAYSFVGAPATAQASSLAAASSLRVKVIEADHKSQNRSKKHDHHSYKKNYGHRHDSHGRDKQGDRHGSIVIIDRSHNHHGHNHHAHNHHGYNHHAHNHHAYNHHSQNRYHKKNNHGHAGSLLGAIVGGVVGGIVGSEIDGGRNRETGTILGIVTGAIAGAAIGKGTEHGRRNDHGNKERETRYYKDQSGHYKAYATGAHSAQAYGSGSGSGSGVASGACVKFQLDEGRYRCVVRAGQ